MQQTPAGQQAQTTNPPIPTPPTAITTKDLLYVKDMLSWELLAMKKCQHFAKECTDTEIRTAIDNAGRMHLRHYNMLLGHLKTDNNAAMRQLPQTQQS